MPMLERPTGHEAVVGVEHTPFPAASKHSAGVINGTPTDVCSITFADKILVTISQGGRLSQWIHVPLSSASPMAFETALPTASTSGGSNDMLPLACLCPKTLMGGGGERRETLGHLCASHVATMIATRNPKERRTVLVGLGLVGLAMERESWFDMLELLQKAM